MSGADTSIAALGAFHGLNPAMGWLFAVALGLQQGSRRAVFQALPPIALGHAAAIAAAVVVIDETASLVTADQLRIGGAVLLVAVAVWKLARNRHLRWVGFRLRARDLVLWSFLMSSAHGAGLMLLPFLIGGSVDTGGWSLQGGMAAVAVHTAAMIAVAGVVAVAVYEVIGVDVLRRAWVNVDQLWPVAFLVAAAVTLLG